MKKSTNKVQKMNFSANEIKRSVKIVLYLLFIFSNAVAYSQSKDTNKIPLKEINKNIKEESLPKREFSILSVLPDVIHDTTNSELIIESQYVTFESVTYYITDVDGVVISSGELTLVKNIEEFLSISVLPSGTYNIILEIENEYFQGEFDVNTF